MRAWIKQLAHGSRFVSTDAVRLEGVLAEHPHDTDSRAQLMGYYRDQPTKNDQIRLHHHLFYMIEYHPDVDTSPTNTIIASDYPVEYRHGLSLWVQATRLRTVAVFQNAIRYVALEDRELACEWALECTKEDETNPTLQSDLAQWLRRTGLTERALASYEVAYRLAGPGGERRAILAQAITCALEAERFERMPWFLSRIADESDEGPAWGLGTYYAHIMHGIEALGYDVQEAAKHLAAAGEQLSVLPVTTSIEIGNQFGNHFPDTVLAHLLVTRGRLCDVERYVLRCQRFVNDARIVRWLATLDLGESPWRKSSGIFRQG